MEKSTTTYGLHTNFVQQVICGVFQFLTSMYGLYELLVTINEQVYNPMERPADLLPGFFQVVSSTWVPVWAYTIWSVKLNFQSIMKNNSNSLIIPNPIIREPIRWSWKNTLCCHTVIIANIVLQTTSIVIWSTVGTCEVTAKPSNNTSRMHGLLTCSSNVDSVWLTDLYLDKKCTLEWLIKIPFYFYFCLVSICMIFTPSITVLTFRHMSIEFSKSLSNEADENEIAVFYNYVKIMVENLNNATSSINFLMIIDGIQYYSRLVIVLFGCRNWFLISLEILWFLMHGATLIIAAESNLRVNQYKEWITRRASQNKLNTFPCKSKLLLEYIHVCNEPVAIRGGQFFYITYGSIGTGMGLLATYTIITLQLGTTS